MKKIFISLSLILYFLSAHCQDRDFKKISYGFQLVKFQNEFGIGVHLLSPEFKNLRVNVKTNLNWLNHLDVQNNQTWTEFLNNQVGINYQICITNHINLYSEGGIAPITLSAMSQSKLADMEYLVLNFSLLKTQVVIRHILSSLVES